MGDRPTGTQSWRLSRPELVIQHHSPPISVSLSYYLLLTLYSEKSRNTSNQLAVLKSLSFPQVSVSLSEIPIHSTSQTCCRKAILPLCLSSPSLLPSVIRPCPQTSPSAVKAAPLTPVSPRASPVIWTPAPGIAGCMYWASHKVRSGYDKPAKEGPWARGANPWGSFLCPFQGRVSPWTFYLVRLIVCKKGILKLACASQPNTSRTEASMWEVILERLSPSRSFPTPACLIHHIKTVPSRKKPNQVTYLLKDPPWLPTAFRQKSEHFIMR